MSENPREVKGFAIAALGNQIQRVDPCTYRVKSQNGNGWYLVRRDGQEWKCSCPDHAHRNVKCKHAFSVEASILLRGIVARSTVIEPVDISTCPTCHSDLIVKHGVRHNGHGDIQRFKCKSCGKWFVVNLGFERMKASPKAITSAMQLYFTGESLRNVQRFLRLQGVKVSHVAIYKWIRKYVALMQKYVEQITPKVSDTWRADELYLKVKGDMKYLFALMDDETRFWIAQEVADTKFAYDAGTLLRVGKEIAGKRPMTLITDGLPAYHEAYLKEYWTLKGPRTKHISHITLKRNRNNNKMERFNGEIRDREKIIRGIKKPETPILSGYQIYHNYLRPHEALDGRTPAEACGIQVKGENKWLTLIQNASRS